MYAAGMSHVHKRPSAALLAAIARGEIAAGTSVEVLQEILHRHRAIGRWAEGSRLYDRVRVLMDTIVEVTIEDLDSARELLDTHSRLSARDAVHVSTALNLRCTAICSYDSGFDSVTTIVRQVPEDLLPRS